MASPRLPLQDTGRSEASASSGNATSMSGRRLSRLGFLNTGSKLGNIILQVSVGVFCLGIVLQALSNTSDPYRCGALVKHGSWPPYSSPPVDDAMDYEQLESLKKDGRELPPARPFEKWEPAGCRMHEYSREDIGYCLGGKRILFVGDSAARIIFFAALTRLDHEAAEWLLRTTFVEDNPRHDLSIESESVVLDFLWDPWLNSSMFAAELSPADPQRSDLFTAAGEPDPPPKADLVIVGSSGLWAARNAGDEYFETFKTATDFVARSMKEPVRSFSGPRESSPDGYIFFTPVTMPRYDMLPVDRAETLSPERIDRMNYYLASLPSTVQSHILTAYNEMTYHVPEAYEETGLHVDDAVAERWVDIPLNARCNGLLAKLAEDRPQSLAFETTCCVEYPSPLSSQRLLFVPIVVAILLPAVFFGLRRGAIPRTACIAVSFVGLAVLLCYTTDRTHLLPKAETRYSLGWIYFTSIATMLASIASRRQARVPSSEISQQHGFLPRHISDEWKGLMQVAYLLLAYQNGLDKPVPTNWSEFVMNSHLFLSAFGHASYFLKTGDCSFRRIASVLFRLNILPCLLVFMLDGLASGTPASVSHLYHFSRLVSFWFLVTCVTIGLGSQKFRSRPGSMLGRVLLSALFMGYGILVPRKVDFFKYASRAGTIFLKATWEADVMRSTVASAWCSPFFGMAIAVISHRVCFIRSRTTLVHGLPQQGRSRQAASAGHGFITKGSSWIDRRLVNIMFPNEFTEPLYPMFVIFCSVFAFGFANMITVSPPTEAGIYFPLSTSVAILCFAVARNCHDKLLSTFLYLPSVLGGIALELTLLHNHILLSGNGTGRLRLFTSYMTPMGGIYNLKVAVYQSVEVVSIFVVFVAVSWSSHQAVRQLATMLFGSHSKASTSESDYDLSISDNSFRKTKKVKAWSSIWVSDSRLRAAYLLFALWGWSRYYI